MENRLPNSLPLLCSRAEDMADGCNLYETPLGILHHKELPLRTQLGLTRTKQNTYQNARACKVTALEELADADRTATELIVATRDVLKPHLGTSWSQSWVETGFVTNSLEVPLSRAGRLALLPT